MNPKIKVLRVDDEAIELTMFKLFLSGDYEILTALNGLEALEVLASTPDVKIVFTDYQMPGMNGIEFINKAKEQFPDVTFYLVSAMPNSIQEIWQAVESKLIFGYLQKPLKRAGLLTAINDAIATKLSSDF